MQSVFLVFPPCLLARLLAPPRQAQAPADLHPLPPPGGARTAIRRRAAADQKEKIANVRPSSTRAAGAGGSSSTMLSMWNRGAET